MLPPLRDANGFYTFADGSNIRNGTNPPYAVSDFIAFYPQFGPNSTAQYVVPQTVIQAFIDMANGCIQQVRWRGMWQVAMGLFVAHFCALFLQTQASADSGAAAVFEAGRAQGVLTGESVGDVSYSADSNVSSVDGWAAWNLTAFGQQLATFGKMVGLGGIYVW